MMPPNLTSSADTPRSVAPPFPPAGAGTATGAAGVAAEGTPAEDLADGDALVPPAAGLDDPADDAAWVPVPDALTGWVVRNYDPTLKWAQLPVPVDVSPVRIRRGVLEVGAE